MRKIGSRIDLHTSTHDANKPIPDFLFDSAIKMLEEARKEGRQFFIAVLRDDALQVGKATTDEGLALIVSSIINEVASRNGGAAAAIAVQALIALGEDGNKEPEPSKEKH